MSTPTEWILLRGLAREAGHWDRFPSVFENIAGAKSIYIELPGTGKYHQQTSPSSIRKIVDHIEQNTQLPSKCYLMAHSMGAQVALEMIRRQPERFLGVVFVNTSIKGISPTFHRLRWSAFKIFISYLFSTKTALRREKMKFEMTCNHLEIKDDTIRTWLEIQKKRPVSWRTIWNQLKAAAFYDAKKPNLPILVLDSLGDHMVNPICSEKIAEKWEATLRTHLWAGHDIFHDDPQWIATQVQSWLPH